MAEILKLGEVWETKFYNQDNEQLGINVRHWRVSQITAGSASDTELANGMATVFQPLYNQLCDANSAFFGVGAQRAFPLPRTVFVHSSGIPVANGIGGAGLARQICGLISLRSNVIGRANRGRLYVPFPAGVDNQGIGAPTQNYTVRLTNLANALLAPQVILGAGGTATMRAVIFHRKTGTSVDVTSAPPVLAWATQRRRGQLGRPNISPW